MGRTTVTQTEDANQKSVAETGTAKIYRSGNKSQSIDCRIRKRAQKWPMFRVHQIDLVTAFLDAEVDRDIYVTLSNPMDVLKRDPYAD